MTGTLTATGLELENAILEPRVQLGSVHARSNYIYIRSEAASDDSFVSTTTSTEFVTVNLKGMSHCTFQFDNRDDEDIDGGGANDKDLHITVNVSNDPNFGPTSYVLVDDLALGEGEIQTWRLGPREMDFSYMEIMLDGETEDSPTFFDFYFYARE